MKIRNSFVSNSSSSSFIFIGKICKDWDEVLKCKNKENLMVICPYKGHSDCEDDVFPLKRAYMKIIKEYFEKSSSIAIMEVFQQIDLRESSKIGPLAEEFDLLGVEKDYLCSKNLGEIKDRYSID